MVAHMKTPIQVPLTCHHHFISRVPLTVGNLVILCMGAISGSVGASSVFPINLLVCYEGEFVCNGSARDYRLRARPCCHMNIMGYPMF